MSTAAVFLDRDGVLNEALVRDGRPYPPTSAEAIRLLPGAAAACETLVGAGLRLIVVSNQPDIARGTLDPMELEAINARLRATLPLDEMVMCPHDDADECACRKPKPGMILEAARRWGVDLHRSVTVGDRWRDVAAGRAAGTHTVHVDRHYAEQAPAEPDLTVSELEESVPWIIRTAVPAR